eukprot:COSAG05_NODE_922_length_6585_cov_180.946038_4_plen_236_part_00
MPRVDDNFSQPLSSSRTAHGPHLCPTGLWSVAQPLSLSLAPVPVLLSQVSDITLSSEERVAAFKQLAGGRGPLVAAPRRRVRTKDTQQHCDAVLSCLADEEWQVRLAALAVLRVWGAAALRSHEQQLEPGISRLGSARAFGQRWRQRAHGDARGITHDGEAAALQSETNPEPAEFDQEQLPQAGAKNITPAASSARHDRVALIVGALSGRSLTHFDGASRLYSRCVLLLMSRSTS